MMAFRTRDRTCGGEGPLREWGCVALSRARSETRLYLGQSDLGREAHGRSLEETDGASRLAEALTRSAKDQLALERAGVRADPGQAQRVHLEELCARAERRLAEARVELENLGWWERRRRGLELRGEIAFQRAALDEARSRLARLPRELGETHPARAMKPELSLARLAVARSREPAVNRPEREPPGIDLGW